MIVAIHNFKPQHQNQLALGFALILCMILLAFDMRPNGLFNKDKTESINTKTTSENSVDVAGGGGSSTKPKIAIIIDDMAGGVDTSWVTREMPANVTLSFLPYGSTLRAQAKAAIMDGHEIWLHLPMEPISGAHDHPMMLRASMSKDEINEVLDAALSSFNGYVGVNNHMGSLLTQDEAAMDIVMTQLSQRGLYFIDSKTIGNSVAYKIARAHGVKTAKRDVFIDHIATKEYIQISLDETKRTAQEKGFAIAIGHPNGLTIDALSNWIPKLEEEGFEIVPASELVN